MTQISATNTIYAKTLKSLGIGVYKIDTHGKILFMDDMALFAFDSQDLFASDSSMALHHISDLIVPIPPFELLPDEVKKNKYIKGFLYPFKTRAGHKRVALLDAVFVTSEQSSDYIQGTVRMLENPAPTPDITFEMDNGSQPSLIDELNRELDLLLYVLSHDLKAPLRAIDGFTLAVIEDYSDRIDDIGQDFLNRIQRAGQTLNRYIESILELSRKTRGDIIQETIDLTGLAGKIVDDMGSKYDMAKVIIKIQDNLSLKGDRRLILEMMNQLLDNALKFSVPVPEPRIEVKADYHGEKLIFRVNDNGVGFDMNYARDRLFGLFQIMHPQTRFDGIGLGLAMVKRIVNRHQGQVWAESEENKGTCIYFTI